MRLQKLIVLIWIAAAACQTFEKHRASDGSIKPHDEMSPLQIRGGRATCFSDDSVGSRGAPIRYSNVAVAEESYDMSGEELAFWRDSTGWVGTIRTAKGELGAPVPLLSLSLDPPSGRILLSYAHGEALNMIGEMTGVITCKRIDAIAMPYPGTRERRVLVRIAAPGEIPRIAP